nr:6-phosphogluconolactonase [uncultured Acetatifactor sp.]
MLLREIHADRLKASVYENRREMGKAAARAAAAAIQKVMEEKGEANVIFAAAPSQNEMLEALLEEEIDFSAVNAFHMDEYMGLGPEDDRSFASYLTEHLFGKASFRSVHLIAARGDTAEGCSGYAALLKDYPPDVVCMGIGENGHIAFNDPPVADFEDKEVIKTVELEEACRRQQVHDGCFGSLEEVPRYALTLTVPALMAAEYIVCTVPGPAKAEAVRKTLYGNIGEHCPATALRRHRNAEMFLDRDSARGESE